MQKDTQKCGEYACARIFSYFQDNKNKNILKRITFVIGGYEMRVYQNTPNEKTYHMSVIVSNLKNRMYESFSKESFMAH